MIHSCLCVLVLAAQIHVPAAPWSVGDYVAELDRLTELLSTATPEEADAISSRLAPRWHVQTGSEQVAVDTSWLVSALRQARETRDEWPSVRERLRRRLLAMREHATAPGVDASPAVLHDTMRGAVERVLARAEFQQSAGSRWREQLQERIGAWLESFFSRIGIAGLGGRRTAIIFAWVAAVAALGGLGIWLARTLAASSRAVSIGIDPGRRQRLSARDWALRAVAALQAGDAREAVRCAYHGALRRLEDDGVWRLDEARTPREYLRMLPPDDAREAAVRELTVLFEQVWYGNRAIDTSAAGRVGMNLERLGCLHAADRAT